MLKNTKVGMSNPINQKEQKYIRSHHKNTPVVQMAKHLRRATIMIYDWMDINNLPVFSTRPDHGQAHQNRRFVKKGCFDINSFGKMF